ncbi:hypothetical protein GE061_002058 [Apolygus lucorum]|uniref:Protein rolling stone n=1 Tax=Apolygus lucorum TaxID=248454 RepID=A0A8S9X5E4_APOLU|nr:hypothetical protein GE061_002058 [Apolygus lucorum]
MTTFFGSCARSARDFAKFIEKYEEYSEADTGQSCWQKNPGVSMIYLIYRWIQFIFHTAFAFMSIFELGRWYAPEYTVALTCIKSTKYYAKWLLYLTHWGLLVNLVQAFLAAWVVQKAYAAQKRVTSESTEGYKPLINAYCKLFVTAIHLSTYITLGFWLMVYEPQTCSVDLVTLSEHGFGTLLLLVDLVVAGTPYKLIYGLYSIILSFIYICLTFVHFLFGALDRFDDKTYIYEKCDWNYPVAVIFYYIISVVLLASFHLTLWSIYLVRRRVSVLIRNGVEGGTHNSPSQRQSTHQNIQAQ